MRFFKELYLNYLGTAFYFCKYFEKLVEYV